VNDLLLSATGIHKTYGTTDALAGAGIEVRAGEIVALMGPSGAGKSTLLHCLAGIVRPDAGTITYAGQDLVAMSDKARSALRRTEFGFVFQFGQLVPELTCLDNVTLPLRLAKVPRVKAEGIAQQWLERLEVPDVAKKRPGDVSGGQAQRVAVARALISDPRVVFADEPTGALDSYNGEKVMRMLTDAARQSNTAVVLVTHEARVAAYADREVIVRDGKAIDRALHIVANATKAPKEVSDLIPAVNDMRLRANAQGWLLVGDFNCPPRKLQDEAKIPLGVWYPPSRTQENIADPIDYIVVDPDLYRDIMAIPHVDGSWQQGTAASDHILIQYTQINGVTLQVL
jgi:putative ABC transport system ATP-binding protein